MANKVRIAIIGLGFGSEFIPIFQNHPDAEMYAICQRNPETLHKIGEAFGVTHRYTKYEDVLKDPNVDAVHINTPIPDHASQSLAALRAGKHVACTVPMATTVDECRAIVAETRKQKKNYMMMETVVFSREFLFVREIYEKGDLGRLQFMPAAISRRWPAGPVIGKVCRRCITRRIASGRCWRWRTSWRLRSPAWVRDGSLRKLAAKYGSPFAVESAHIRLQGFGCRLRSHAIVFETARQYRESFDIYGDKVSFECPAGGA